jgi:pyruvate formate lyase activating enzyme
VAVDTCGYVTDPGGIEVLKQADLLLFDIKGMDGKRHKENTGVSNGVIWENLRMLGELEKPIIIRLPVIPGYNDDEEELRQAARALTSIKSVKRVDILPVHQFGKVKYTQIGKEYEIDPELCIPEERRQRLKEMFESYGFTTQIGG